ncbi:MAG: hypothetical protein QIT36_gp104 [Methanophagales virus GBV301]|uniref:Uncharacterized protein n=1 Tax=Methanophagales virus GBV301 TaxID=2999280 RepID=A0A9E8VG54_9CAUD|nr:MAG: hypothetical protein QIT36_gp104 [Methanophagales virus GBV301]WAE39528.1 MAG: hypothetical protein LDLAKGPJ_00104 [Methanophagales virus GBV301]
MVQVGDKVYLLSLRNSYRLEKKGVIEVGEKGLLLRTPESLRFLGKTLLKKGDACRLYSTSNMRWARGRESIIEKYIDIKLWFACPTHNWALADHGAFLDKYENGEWQRVWQTSPYWYDSYATSWHEFGFRINVDRGRYRIGLKMRSAWRSTTHFWWDDVRVIPDMGGENLLKNGSFELGNLDYWTVEKEQATLQVEEGSSEPYHSYPREGQYYLWVKAWGSGWPGEEDCGRATLTQEFTLY